MENFFKRFNRRFGQNNFGWIESQEFFSKFRCFAFSGKEFAGRNIGHCYSEDIFIQRRRSEIIIAAVFEDAVRHRTAGGDHFDDFALYQPLCLFRIFDLFADSDTISGSDHFRQVIFYLVVGESCEGDFIFICMASAGESQTKNFTGNFCVFEKHLEEISHAEEKNSSFILRFDGGVLLHHGSFSCNHSVSLTNLPVIPNFSAISSRAALASSISLYPPALTI